MTQLLIPGLQFINKLKGEPELTDPFNLLMS